MRMFAAVVPPPGALEDLDAFLEPRRASGPELRWTSRELWHVTLAFMAEVPERLVDQLVEELGAAVAGRDPVTVRCAGGGAFPTPYEARVTWVGVEGAPADLDGLTMLAKSVRSASAHVGASPAGGPFTPHLTLARSRRPFEATRWLRVLDAYEGPAWTTREVTLFASQRRSRHGAPHYEPLATMLVGGGEG